MGKSRKNMILQWQRQERYGFAMISSVVHIPKGENEKWESATGEINLPNGWEKKLHCVRCGCLAGPSVFDASRDPANGAEYLGNEKIIDNKGNFSLVQMGLRNGV